MAEADPRGFLVQNKDGAILDEIQRLPVLISYIQGMVDKTKKRGQFILTGSHQQLLHEAISQSLAGRTAILSLWPFSIPEIRRYDSPHDPFDLIYRGFFPRLHEERLEPRRFFNGYLQTYVERDVRALIQLLDLSQFQKFLVLLAGRVGQIVNLTSLGNNVGASAATFAMDFVKRLEWFTNHWASSAPCPARSSITASGRSMSGVSVFSIRSTWKASG